MFKMFGLEREFIHAFLFGKTCFGQATGRKCGGKSGLRSGLDFDKSKVFKLRFQ